MSSVDKFEVVDLSPQPKSVQGRRLAKESRSLAARGADVPKFTRRFWTVCSVCGLPSQPNYEVRSLCCEGLMRLHGWGA